MNYRAFNNYLNVILNAIDAQGNRHTESDEKIFDNNGRWALHRLEKEFRDKHHNILHWLKKEPCVFISDKTGKPINIEIGREREALYLFLVFCKRINERKEISDDFRDYLMLTITRSCTADDAWEGC